MSTYILKSINEKKSIKGLMMRQSYEFSPKNSDNRLMKIKNLNLYNAEQIEKILMKKYLKQYQKFISVVNSVIQSDDATDGDFMLCMDEAERLQSILVYRYKKFMKKQMYEYFLNDLMRASKYLEGHFVEFRMLSGMRMH